VGINRRNRAASGQMTMLPNPPGHPSGGSGSWRYRRPRAGRWACCSRIHAIRSSCTATRGAAFPVSSIVRPAGDPRGPGAGVHAQFLQGCAGDIRPRITADLDKGKFRKTIAADRDRAGRDMAEAVLVGLRQPGRGLTLDIAARTARVGLKRGKPPPNRFTPTWPRTMTPRPGRPLLAR